jgi:hypothetical protein
MSPGGVISSSRMSVAKMPPIANMMLMLNMYRSAMRLWSTVSSHDLTP